jgi:uncharacterized protein (DUF433 family)
MNAVSINPKIQGGIPCVLGTRIPVVKVAYLYFKKNISLKKIVSEYYLTLSIYQLRQAIEWYEKNRGRYDGLDV